MPLGLPFALAAMIAVWLLIPYKPDNWDLAAVVFMGMCVWVGVGLLGTFLLNGFKERLRG